MIKKQTEIDSLYAQIKELNMKIASTSQNTTSDLAKA